MARANGTSPAEYTPRSSTADERKQLADWLISTGAYDAENARLTAEAAYIAVFDDYRTGGPGYAGKVMSVIWDGAPSMFDLFTWQGGTMERNGREYDEKECDRCGSSGGTLCSNCWRDHSNAYQEELVAALEAALSALDIAQKRDPGQAGVYHCPSARAAVARARGGAA